LNLKGGIPLMVVACHIGPVDQVDLERIRTAYAEIGRDGTPSADLFDRAVEWHNAPELPGATVHHGIDAMMADIRAQAEAWRERRFEPVEVAVAHVLTIRAGKVVRVQAFIDRDRALRAAGVASR
jgi:hypothetical protein